MAPLQMELHIVLHKHTFSNVSACIYVLLFKYKPSEHIKMSPVNFLSVRLSNQTFGTLLLETPEISSN